MNKDNWARQGGDDANPGQNTQTGSDQTEQNTTSRGRQPASTATQSTEPTQVAADNGNPTVPKQGSASASASDGVSAIDDDDAERVLNFTEDKDFDADRVFDGGADSQTRRQSFTWSLDDDKAQVKLIYLVQVADAPGEIGGPYEPKETPVALRTVDLSGDVDILVNASPTGVDLDFTKFTPENKGLEYGGAYAVKVHWEREDGLGKGSVSGYFSVLDPDDDDEDMQKKVQDSLSKLDYYENGFESSGDAIPSAAPTSKGPATAAESSDNPSSETASSNAASGSGDNSDSSAERGGGGGLAPGTIAGIVVGVVGGLALIGALVFFLLRRRRRHKTKQHHGHVVSQHEADMSSYALDKVDGNAAHSPYSDDGHGVAATGFPAHDAAAAPHTTAASHEPVRGDPDAADTPSRQRDYSHLVEDGMTEDDIRRLEEEERQLDDEIARARRRR
ncbi:uncharacterized protein F5Z01DRAFT_310824 [Emericellopsis atlantica]|uniref:Uncharacterized protein n=1 Tax=Emericellopsis atlantica TaxID=2614577 RepID=A0A9P8CT21_9HYPO|nr:uncharacterized protein F5Z01DRAFT_310824 [Emericellopsis atlantica]KAG9257952.1 hypothetical protein F5Z01DRAFT_310824 [Emericellopsis atlantica]